MRYCSAFPLSSNHISPLHALLFVLYLSSPLSSTPERIHQLREISSPSATPFLSHLSRSEWLSPISPHQMDGVSQGPWRWCCSLGGTQWADMFEGFWRTIQCSESWKRKVQKVFNTTPLHYIRKKRFNRAVSLCRSPPFPFINFFVRHVFLALLLSHLGIKVNKWIWLSFKNIYIFKYLNFLISFSNLVCVTLYKQEVGGGAINYTNQKSHFSRMSSDMYTFPKTQRHEEARLWAHTASERACGAFNAHFLALKTESVPAAAAWNNLQLFQRTRN